MKTTLRHDLPPELKGKFEYSIGDLVVTEDDRTVTIQGYAWEDTGEIGYVVRRTRGRKLYHATPDQLRGSLTIPAIGDAR